MMVLGGVFGFFWPITVATAAPATTLPLYYTAVRNELPLARSVAVAVGGIGALVIGLLPLVPSVGGVGCGDEGHFISSDPSGMESTFFLGVWFPLLWWLYYQARRPAREAWVPAAITVLGTGVGLVFERVQSQVIAETSCNSGSVGSYAQAAAALLIAVVTGLSIRMGMLISSRR